MKTTKKFHEVLLNGQPLVIKDSLLAARRHGFKVARRRPMQIVEVRCDGKTIEGYIANSGLEIIYI